MADTIEEYRKSFSLLKDINGKTRSILGGLPAEVITAFEDIERELITLEGFDRDVKTSWSLSPKKRRLKKEIDKSLPKIKDGLSKAVRLHVSLLRKYLEELQETQAEIMAFDLRLGRQLTALKFPSTRGGFAVVLPLLARFVSNVESISKGLRDSINKQANDMLEQNRALIKTYDRFVGIDKSDVPLSAERETIDVAHIGELFKTRKTLRAEHEYLTSRRGEVVDTLRAKFRVALNLPSHL